MSSHERAATKRCWCQECTKAYQREYRSKNRGRLRSKRAAYRATHQAEIAAAQEKWRRANPEYAQGYLRQYRNDNKAKLAALKKKYYDENRETILAGKRAYTARVSQRVIETRRARRQSDPAALAKHNHQRALRRAAETRATPAWADMAQIEAAYKKAQELSEANGAKYSVDHIYPLRGKYVSGLHVHYNLQVIPLRANCSKQNRMVDEIV